MNNQKTNNSLPFILLPGLGADYRSFDAQADAFERLIIPDWVTPDPDDTLDSYAERLAQSMIDQQLITADEPCFVGGHSFGGMLAPKVARRLKTRACFLLSTVRHPSEIPSRQRRFRRLLTNHPKLSRAIVTDFQSAVRFWLRLGAPLTCKARRSLMQQFADMPIDWFMWASLVVLTWSEEDPTPQYRDVDGEAYPVFQIHGTWDPVLSCRRTTPDVKIRFGGHLIPQTRAERVNRFILDGMQQTLDNNTPDTKTPQTDATPTDQ